ncbi:MBL fold metallo-hydrolase [Oscillibacter sp.]|uniref:MBL fold metallo-hydrolase n=1 Tax=Oscillibacter sp. TaxID=1945593 RepID=UPI002D8068FA|nr:MBL fold metallo-hydrolase [Oscillibacter sp.]
MKLKIWGSGGGEGVPSMFCSCATCQKARELKGRDVRTRSCSMLNDRVMLDFGQDVFLNAVRYGANLSELSAIVFTHAHIDHLASEELCMKAPDYCDIPEGKRLPIYGNSTCISEIRRELVYDLGRVPDIFDFHVLRAWETVQVGTLRITPLSARHTVLEEAFLLLIEEGDVRYLHCMDTSTPGEETMKYLAGKRLDGITMDCTYGDSREQSDGHMGLPANIRLKERLLAQGSADEHTQFLLSHIAHHSTLMHEDLAALAAKSGLTAAYDGFETWF